MFHFTSERLARALAERRRAGVDVRVLLDASQADAGFVRRLREDGLAVRLARLPEDARFHHKFAVLDERRVITGSYNWTYRADRVSHENIVVLRDVPAAAVFRAEFERLWTDPELSRP
jgi:mitochondrial cardiolipin hydrolase